MRSSEQKPPTSDLQPLRDWLAAHPSPHERVSVMRGGNVGVGEDGSHVATMPWVDYEAAIPDFWLALDAAGWSEVDTSNHMDVIDRWLTAHGAERLTADLLARMDRSTLWNALRWYNRGERFSDGLWAAAYRDGVLHAGARALLALS